MPALGSDHSRDTAACNCSRGNTIKLKTNKQTRGNTKSWGKNKNQRGCFQKRGNTFLSIPFPFKV